MPYGGGVEGFQVKLSWSRHRPDGPRRAADVVEFGIYVYVNAISLPTRISARSQLRQTGKVSLLVRKVSWGEKDESHTASHARQRTRMEGPKQNSHQNSLLCGVSGVKRPPRHAWERRARVVRQKRMPHLGRVSSHGSSSSSSKKMPVRKFCEWALCYATRKT